MLGVVEDQHVSGGGLGGDDEGALRHVASSAGWIKEELVKGLHAGALHVVHVQTSTSGDMDYSHQSPQTC